MRRERERFSSVAVELGEVNVGVGVEEHELNSTMRPYLSRAKVRLTAGVLDGILVKALS